MIVTQSDTQPSAHFEGSTSHHPSLQQIRRYFILGKVVKRKELDGKDGARVVIALIFSQLVFILGRNRHLFQACTSPAVRPQVHVLAELAFGVQPSVLRSSYKAGLNSVKREALNLRNKPVFLGQAQIVY